MPICMKHLRIACRTLDLRPSHGKSHHDAERRGPSMYQKTKPIAGTRRIAVHIAFINNDVGAPTTEISAHMLTASAISTQSPKYSTIALIQSYCFACLAFT